MQLRIRKGHPAFPKSASNHKIATFKDLDALALEVARDVKTWARQVPVRKQSSRFILHLVAEWTEPAPAQKRK